VEARAVVGDPEPPPDAVLLPVVVNSSSIKSSLAAVQAKAAYEQVGTASQTYSSSVKQCSSTSSSDSQLLQCVSQATSTWGTAVRQYQTSLAGIAYPSSAQSDANAAVAAAGAAVTKIDALAAAPDVATYQSLSQSPSFSASLNTVDSSFRQLYNNLNAS